MLRVFKYDITIADSFEIDLPQNAQILKAEVQHGLPRLWALVNPQNPMKRRKFIFAGTGHPINQPMEILKFISTFQMQEGALIFHILK